MRRRRNLPSGQNGTLQARKRGESSEKIQRRGETMCRSDSDALFHRSDVGFDTKKGRRSGIERRCCARFARATTSETRRCAEKIQRIQNSERFRGATTLKRSSTLFRPRSVEL